MFQLPDDESAEGVADWIELGLAVGEHQLSRAKVGAIIQSVSGSEPDETFLSDIWRHLQTREAQYYRRFFRCDEDLVRRSLSGTAPLEYVSCLLFSLYGVSDEHRLDPKVFERIAAVAIKNYVGGKAFVFGWPVLSGVQADIGSRVRQLAVAARESFAEAPAERYKDRGVDVIAWKPFEEHITGEHRSNQIVVLAQCAAGSNWRQKTTQLPYRSWTQYIHWACDPVQGFAVPRVIASEIWHDISRECEGILFDRIRIMNLLPNGVEDGGFAAQMQEWADSELEQARA